MEIKNFKDKATKVYGSKYETTITKAMLEVDMYELKLSQRAIAEKYKVGKGTIQNLQNKYKMQILNMFERRVPRELTYEQKQLILGTCLADGHLFKKNENRNAALSIKHSVKQKAWAELKFETLKEFVRTSPTIQVSKLGEKTHKCISFRTLTHDYFTYLYNLIYDENKEKHLNLETLNKIDALGLAVMYMDDGTAHHNCRDFCFDCFSFEEQKVFCKYLKNKYDIEARVIKYKDKFRTRIIRKSVPKFQEIIRPFVIDEMKYKL